MAILHSNRDSDVLAHAKPGAEGHPLADHLREVGALSAGFSARFDSSAWGQLAGRWHDLGKYRAGFQRYIRSTSDPDAHVEKEAVVGQSDKTHSAAGARHALATLGKHAGRVLAFLIAGHHAGLPDGEPADGGGASLAARMASPESDREYREALLAPVPGDILETGASLALPAAAKSDPALWMRMLFSSLVDADFLDTERYFSPDRFASRGGHPRLAAMQHALDRHLDALAGRVRADGDAALLRSRTQVLAACREMAELGPGCFTLTVPTGGGKTLSSLAFALRHALRNGQRRIVYAIPYTSIIEQTAGVFRAVFEELGADLVIEHHSNLDVAERAEDHATRLAAENWDAPLIVTTNVQLFESLHASRTSRCRKLHNLVDSVIVLDEAQMLPRDFLAPVLHALKVLVANYGVTVVLCTATQPMLASRFEPVTGKRLLSGIDDARPIIDDTAAFFAAFDRVELHWPATFALSVSWPSLAADLRSHECVLAIVNSRKDARELFAALADPHAIHLSALMCAEHRGRKLAEIRGRLAARRAGEDARPLRVISTQLVEAGVDVDFPVVFRALAGLDSIAQAAGRCNREGRLPGKGAVHVFVPPTRPPPGLLRQGEQATRALARTGHLVDPLAPATFRIYFDHLYAQDAVAFDRHDILALLAADRLAFRSAGRAFRLIDEDGETVVVPFHPDGGSRADSPVHGWLGVLEKDGNARWARRKLQRFVVGVQRHVFERMLEHGDVVQRAGLWLAMDSRYDPILGLLPVDDHGRPEDYMA